MKKLNPEDSKLWSDLQTCYLVLPAKCRWTDTHVCTSGKNCNDQAENIRCHHKKVFPYELEIYALLKVTALNAKLYKF